MCLHEYIFEIERMTYVFTFAFLSLPLSIALVSFLFFLVLYIVSVDCSSHFLFAFYDCVCITHLLHYLHMFGNCCSLNIIWVYYNTWSFSYNLVSALFNNVIKQRIALPPAATIGPRTVGHRQFLPNNNLKN